MKKILKYITLLIVTVMCSSCGEYSMKGDIFTVIKEESVNDTLSRYTLRYKINRIPGTGKPTSELDVLMNKNAFAVGDKIKLVKVE